MVVARLKFVKTMMVYLNIGTPKSTADGSFSFIFPFKNGSFSGVDRSCFFFGPFAPGPPRYQQSKI